MNKTLTPQKKLIVFGIPLFIIGMMVFLTKPPIFSLNPIYLSIGITFDLLVTVPFVYFLLIKKTNIPKTTVVLFLVLGVVVCSLILPIENQYYLSLFKTWVLPVVELAVLFFVIHRLRKAIKHYKLNKNGSLDFFTTLKSTCYEMLPKWIVIPVVTEIAVFYYGFIDWKKRELKSNEFSYHKNSGTIPLLIAVIFILTIETVTLHVLISKWSTTVTWILTFLSIYSGIQIFGFLKSMFKRPIFIENNTLYLRNGIMAESIIDLSNIASVELSSRTIESDEEIRKLSFLGTLESHNIIIHLKKEKELIGLYGIKKRFKALALHIDNKIEFHSILTVNQKI